MRSSHFRKLNIVGKFFKLNVLNLDFSASLTSFREDCFTCMPNLKFLSLCETRISNLWTTSAALAKLPSLTELRFQNCLCWNASGSCSSSSGRKAHGTLTDSRRYTDGSISNDEVVFDQNLNAEEEDIDIDDINFDQSTLEYSSDDSEVDFSSHHQDFNMVELLPATPSLHEMLDLEYQVFILPSLYSFWLWVTLHLLSRCIFYNRSVLSLQISFIILIYTVLYFLCGFEKVCVSSKMSSIAYLRQDKLQQ